MFDDIVQYDEIIVRTHFSRRICRCDILKNVLQIGPVVYAWSSNIGIYFYPNTFSRSFIGHCRRASTQPATDI